MTAPDQRVTRYSLQPGVYKDSLVLMQLQHRLLERPGVVEAGAAMASAANLELLGAGGLLPDALPDLQAEDLLVVVRATSPEVADRALESVGELLATRHQGGPRSFQPHSLDGALTQLPEARWALVSVPGQYAARVAEDALDRGLNVFLFSDNVEGGDEARLKKLAAERRQMVLGPDCGTAIIAGIGLGFANHVRRGAIGLVGGSGTGLQAVSVAIDSLGYGVSQAIGTGGHDLSIEVGGIATQQALRFLAQDQDTQVIVLISKRPAQAVADRALEWAAACGKPVIVYLQGYEGSTDADSVQLASSLSDAADRAVRLGEPAAAPTDAEVGNRARPYSGSVPTGGLLRGLFAGGTLATETLLQLRSRLAPLFSNISGGSWRTLADPSTSREHTILDLGADELTRGRLHPMIDQESRLARFQAEAEDPDVALIFLDVVLGEGAHGDPAAELAPAIERALETAASQERVLRVVTILVGTEDDPQGLESQVDRLAAAGATVVFSIEDAVRYTDALVVEADATEPMLPRHRSRPKGTNRKSVRQAAVPKPVRTEMFDAPLVAINIGLESFHDSLTAQGAASVHVDWRPPAGGNERLSGILDQLRVNRAAVAAEVSEP